MRWGCGDRAGHQPPGPANPQQAIPSRHREAPGSLPPHRRERMTKAQLCSTAHRGSPVDEGWRVTLRDGGHWQVVRE